MSDLHPWIATPEALAATEKAVQVPMTLMPAKAALASHDDLFREAQALMTEFAQPNGRMYEWPEDKREKYAVREVGFRLNHWLRTRHAA